MAFDEDDIKKLVGIPQLKVPQVQMIDPFTDQMKKRMQEVNAALDANIEYRARIDAATLRAADEAEAQTELLKNQLREVKIQNEQLKENNSTLKELYEKVKEEAEENKAAAEEARKDAKKNARKATIANWFAGLSLFVSVVSITFTVLTFLEIIPWW